MSKNPRVAVIIPAYNSAPYIAQAIESVRSQTYSDYELIVVDDGSTDRTGEIARSIPGVRYLRQENRGPAAARNTAIRSTKADYLAFLDADDLWKPEKLALQIELMEREPRTGLAYCDLEYFQDDYVFPPRRPNRIVTDPPDRLLDLLLYNYINTSSLVLMRRSCLDRVGLFDETFRICEDWNMWLRIARQYEIGHVPRVLVSYRFHGTNTTRGARLRYRYEKRVIEEFCRSCADSEKLRYYCRLALANLHFLYGDLFNYRGEDWRGTYRTLLRLYRENGILARIAREAVGRSLTLRCGWFADFVRAVKRRRGGGSRLCPGSPPEQDPR